MRRVDLQQRNQASRIHAGVASRGTLELRAAIAVPDLIKLKASHPYHVG
jgi:hypothetical protein